MQQATPVPSLTAIMHPGRLIALDGAQMIFTAPTRRRTQTDVTGRFG
ncbi:MAG: hypothetical protein NW223_16635 [Hyphomicrobiaceae bacterium]|nr:hypothetical protein [Hyphomicrobiaceae bacterium]